MEAGISQMQSQCMHIRMSVCNYECMYVHTYVYIFICIEAQGFVINFSSGIYMSMLCDSGPGIHIRKPCFYTDKIQHIIYTHKCIYMCMYVYVHYNIREARYKEYTHISAIQVTDVSSQHILAICQL